MLGTVTSPIDVLTVTSATHFYISAPASATEGTPVSFNVTAEDQFNTAVPGYPGTVHFTSTDSQATLPANTKLTNGFGTFQATFKTSGTQTITATDTVTSSITGVSNSISVGTGAPATVSVYSGTSQTAAINTAFASPLVALVRDSGGNALPGITVTFTAPTTGASGSFAGGVTTATTNSNGLATSPTFTANGACRRLHGHGDCLRCYNSRELLAYQLFGRSFDDYRDQWFGTVRTHQRRIRFTACCHGQRWWRQSGFWHNGYLYPAWFRRQRHVRNNQYGGDKRQRRRYIHRVHCQWNNRELQCVRFYCRRLHACDLFAHQYGWRSCFHYGDQWHESERSDQHCLHGTTRRHRARQRR